MCAIVLNNAFKLARALMAALANHQTRQLKHDCRGLELG